MYSIRNIEKFFSAHPGLAELYLADILEHTDGRGMMSGAVPGMVMGPALAAELSEEMQGLEHMTIGLSDMASGVPKDFWKNPKGAWSYQGGFTVELVPGTPTSNVPTDCRIEGSVVTVPAGRAYQSIGAIQLQSGRGSFYWGYKHLRVIRRVSGSPIWVNVNYRNSV